jgi:ribosome-binding factor A
MTEWQPKIDIFSVPARQKGPKRVQRVADMIKNEIGLLLLSRIKDPRLAHVSIVQVIMTKDLKRAKIFYSVYGDEQEARKAAAGLASATGFIRKHLARELDLRATPVLTFERDLTMVRQEEIERLLKEIDSEDGPAE